MDALRCVHATGRASIGAQLHPWVTPPFDEPLGVRTSFAGNLSPAIEGAKMDRLTDAVAAITGTRPIVYRAGRYGLGPNTAELLLQRGYRIDSSVRAGYRYDAEGGPDHSAVDNHGYCTGPGGALIELPFGTVFTGRMRRGGAGLHRSISAFPRGAGIAARTGMLNRVPLTPEGVPVAEAEEAVRVAVGEGLRVLNFAFHSPSLRPGYTPYVRDEADLARFWTWWDRVLALLARLDVRSASPDDLIAAAEHASAR